MRLRTASRSTWRLRPAAVKVALLRRRHGGADRRRAALFAVRLEDLGGDEGGPSLPTGPDARSDRRRSSDASRPATGASTAGAGSGRLSCGSTAARGLSQCSASSMTRASAAATAARRGLQGERRRLDGGGQHLGLQLPVRLARTGGPSTPSGSRSTSTRSRTPTCTAGWSSSRGPPLPRPVEAASGMVVPGDVVVRAFASIGWRWGGY